MRKLKGYILTEILMSLLLQVMFVGVMVAGVYLVSGYYETMQGKLVARRHAQRVIEFMTARLRYVGLGLWACTSSSSLHHSLCNINMLNLNPSCQLPLSLTPYIWDTSKKLNSTTNQDSGDVVTFLFTEQDLSSGDSEVISVLGKTVKLVYDHPDAVNGYGLKGENIPILDNNGSKGWKTIHDNSLFEFSTGTDKGSIKRYAVAEGIGFPIFLKNFPSGTKLFNVETYGVSHAKSRDMFVPAGSELMALSYMQMFVHNRIPGEGGQFAFRELESNGEWGKTYNQEKGILDIYVERNNNVLTIYVLATGGYNASENNLQPESWPDVAGWPKEYSHHNTYVAKASLKLHNIPDNFTW